MSKLHIQCKTRQQIADEYGVSVRTLARWLQKHQFFYPYRLLLPSDQYAIYSLLGWPSAIDPAGYHHFSGVLPNPLSNGRINAASPLFE